MLIETKKRTIFVVDDTPANLRLLYDILSQADYHVRVYPNGKFMLQAMEQIEPDLILLDIMMPDMDGYEVCEILRRRYNPNIPVIFLSALTESYDKVRAFEAGGQDYITKPIHPEEVLLRLNAQLKNVNEREQFSYNLEEKEKQLQEYQEGLVKTLLRLSGLRDNDTGNHIERVQALATSLAGIVQKEPGSQVNSMFVEAIRLAAPLHDIGKIAVPDAILLKEGKLTEDEWLLMREHVRVGGEVLGELHLQFPENSFIQMAMDIALYHHETWDGQGYVHGLSKEAIPLAARIVSIVDVYDALRTLRPYKPAYTHLEALEMMCQMKGTFDPYLFDLFLTHDRLFSTVFDSIYEAGRVDRNTQPLLII